MQILFFLIVFVFPNYLIAQNKSNCDCSACNQFDFWLGTWEATWQDSSGNNYKGSNSINKILGDCVIEENFDGNPGYNFTGKSFSVYNQKEKLWKQTWVDSHGNYMSFIGKMQDDKMFLSREVEINGETILQRMVFYNITEKNFDWSWEVSVDNGKNWEINWLIHYSRE